MPILSNFPGGSGSGGGGLALAAVSDIQTLVSSGKVYVKWTDPDDLVVADSTLAAWGGTLLVRKAGSMPVSRRDGTIVLDSTTRDQYSDAYFCDSGLTDGVTYYYKFFPYTTTGTYTEDVADEFTATPTAQVSGIDAWLVTGMSASSEAGDGKMTIKWTDPAATIASDGVTLATWGSTTVVVKAGGYPTSKDDTGAAYTLKVTTRNQYASSALTVTGLTNGTKYYIAFFPETTDGGINTATSQRTTGTANRITISTEPTQSGTLTYNANSQTPSWSGYDTAKMTIGGTTSGTTAGSYTATFTPKTDYRWSDGTTTAKEVAWTIGKAAGSLTVSPTAITLNATTKTATITVTRAGTGKISASSNATGIATISPASSTATGSVTFTVSSVNDTTGSATITFSVAADTNYKAPSNKTVAITASFKPTASTTATSGVTYTDGLSGLDAETVSLFGEAISNNSAITNTTSTVYIDFGSVHRKIDIGDQVTLALNGTNYTFDVIGFNHDTLTTAAAYGANTATGKAGMTLQMHDLFATTYQMNSSNTNSGGWKSSAMRTSTMATMKGYLPDEWEAIIKPVNKASGTGGGSSSGTETVSDSCFLLAEIEIFGSTTYSVSGEGTQYAYYKAGNSKVKNKSGSAGNWWERSPRSGNSSFFCYVYSIGSANFNLASSSFGVAFGFCV